jgi:hypothetical protein
MTNFIRLAAVAAALAVAVPTSAQERNQFGVGVSIAPIDSLVTGVPVQVYVPIALAPNFRLEPSLGIRTADADATEESDITLGVGAFYVNRLAPTADMYLGGRLLLNFASESAGAADDSDTDLFIAAALGGEYYFVPKFSIGLEAQLGLYQTGDINGDASGFFTNGLGFLRVYF